MHKLLKTKTIMDYFGNNKNNKNNETEITADNKATTVYFDKIQNSKSYFIFTDGSQLRESKTYKSLSVSWAYVIKEKNNNVIHSESGKLNMNDNNQRAELISIFNALQWCFKNLKGSYDIHIYTDSEYSLKCLTLWIYSWKKSNWKNSKRQDVKHRDVIEPCFELIQIMKKNSINVKINHIRSHTENKDFFAMGNNDADKLARTTSKLSMRN